MCKILDFMFQNVFNCSKSKSEVNLDSNSASTFIHSAENKIDNIFIKSIAIRENNYIFAVLLSSKI